MNSKEKQGEKDCVRTTLNTDFYHLIFCKRSQNAMLRECIIFFVLMKKIKNINQQRESLS